MDMQSEMRAANMTWNYYAYGHTVHAFTLMENPNLGRQQVHGKPLTLLPVQRVAFPL